MSNVAPMHLRAIIPVGLFACWPAGLLTACAPKGPPPQFLAEIAKGEALLGEGCYTCLKEALALFGPARCMFGSNFPIEKLWTPYSAILSTMQALLAGASARERQMIFHDTAVRVYRLE